MVDDSDVELAAWIFNPTTWFGLGLTVMVLLIIALIAASNEKECEAKHCDAGKPKLMDHECVCVTAPE
mgnify:CR=1 FL=1